MVIFSSLKDNYLLGALAPPDCLNFRKDLELVELQSQDYLDEPHSPLSHVYFPTTAIVSLMCLSEDGTAIESAVVGREGVIGTEFFMGGGASPMRAMVQRTGFAYRIKASIFKREFDRNLAVQRASLRYTQTLLTQLAQSVLCNRCHSVDQHLARWLLNSLDRMSGNDLTATHESIANTLGVRRESVTASAGKLKNAGLISSHRGHIRILDRKALEGRACECYQIVKRDFDGLVAQCSAPEHDRVPVTVVANHADKSAAYRRPQINSSSAVYGRAS